MKPDSPNLHVVTFFKSICENNHSKHICNKTNMAVSFVILVMVWRLANGGGGGEYCMGENECSPSENTNISWEKSINHLKKGK